MAEGSSYWAGEEAVLLWLLWERLQAADVLEDPLAAYGVGMETLQAEQLITLIRQAKAILHERGKTVQSAVEAPDGPALVVTRDYRIFIGSRRGQEIRMRPMTKAVFLLFLHHPEGIVFQQIDRYRQELTRYYRRLSRSDSIADIDRSLDRVLDAASREVNVAASRISEALSTLLEEELLPSYIITGERGGTKRIRLDRRLVTWL